MVRFLPFTLLAMAGCVHRPAPAPLSAAAPASQSFQWVPSCMPPAKTGETILMVQSTSNPLLERLRSDAAFGGARYEHSPCYRLVLAFTDGQPRRWVIDAADPRLRPYLAFARSRFSEGERNTAAKQIMAALSSARIPFAFSTGGSAEGFGIYVATAAEVERVRLLIPERYLPITRFHIGIPTYTPERK